MANILQADKGSLQGEIKRVLRENESLKLYSESLKSSNRGLAKELMGKTKCGTIRSGFFVGSLKDSLRKVFSKRRKIVNKKVDSIKSKMSRLEGFNFDEMDNHQLKDSVVILRKSLLSYYKENINLLESVCRLECANEIASSKLDFISDRLRSVRSANEKLEATKGELSKYEACEDNNCIDSMRS